MEEKKQEYRRLLCSICVNREQCDKDKMRVKSFQDRLSIVCGSYKYEQDEV